MNNAPENLAGIAGTRNLVTQRVDPSEDFDPDEVQQLIDSTGVAAREDDNLKDDPKVLRLKNRHRDILIVKTDQSGRTTTTTLSVYNEPGLPRRAAIYSTTSSDSGQDPTVSPPKYYSLKVARSVLSRLSNRPPAPSQ